MRRGDEILVGLDIGTTKVCTVVGQLVDNEGDSSRPRIEIVGIGTTPSRGLRKGVVINIESTVASIRKAVEEAELMAGCDIVSVFVGIAGGHIRGFNSHGVIAIRDKEVHARDVGRVIEAAKAVAIPMDREVIHVIPNGFKVDQQDGVNDPVGMRGVRLEVNCHIVTGAVASAANIIKCCNQTGLNVMDIVLEPLASSYGVLDEEEKELGVALLDIGGGTSDLAVFIGGTLRHSAVLALGGAHITNDIALGLRTPAQPSAEELKIRYGCATTKLVNSKEAVEVPTVGGRKPRVVSRQILCEIIEQRVEEIFLLVQRELEKVGLTERVPAGMVLTGGASNMPGMIEVAEGIFNCPVRVGKPINVGGLTDVVNGPQFATAVGLVAYGIDAEEGAKFRIRDRQTFDGVWSRMREWIKDFIS
ncbi:MAG: cell division protein FtsA [Candidatus Alcyoniella australis]|nr:cell division protein FtsA [Candidatus Alcyoniella australis]